MRLELGKIDRAISVRVHLLDELVPQAPVNFICARSVHVENLPEVAVADLAGSGAVQNVERSEQVLLCPEILLVDGGCYELSKV